jgi:uncharacterized protein YjbJ (UPF0337 family)
LNEQTNEEDNAMNEEILAGQWKQMRGALKSWWGKLSDDDLENIGGQKDKLIGAIQERYGHTLEQAQNEVDRRLSEYRSSTDTSASDLKAKLNELSGNAAGQARGAVTAASDRLERATSYIQENDFKTMATDLGAFIRKYPVQSFLIGISLVYFLFRSRDEN